MSTLSLYNLDKEKLLNNIDDLYIKLSYNYLMKVRFGIGCELNVNDFKLLSKLEDLLCRDLCELNDFSEKIKQDINTLILKYN